MTPVEASLAKACANTLLQQSRALPPYAALLEGVAEMLLGLAAGEKPSDDLLARMQELQPAFRTLNGDQLQLAFSAVETLLTKLHERGEL